MKRADENAKRNEITAGLQAKRDKQKELQSDSQLMQIDGNQQIFRITTLAPIEGIFNRLKSLDFVVFQVQIVLKDMLQFSIKLYNSNSAAFQVAYLGIFLLIYINK
jgi:hypothetical protein